MSVSHGLLHRSQKKKPGLGDMMVPKVTNNHIQGLCHQLEFLQKDPSTEEWVGNYYLLFQGGTSVVVPRCYMMLCPCVYGLQQ